MYRLTRPLALAVTLSVAGLAWLAGIASAQASPVQDPAAPSPCSAVTRMWARPDIVPLGSTTYLTANVAVTCPGSEEAHRHFALVADASTSMMGDPRAQLQQALTEFVDRLPLGDGLTQVAIIEYRSDGEVLCGLTDDRAALRRCIGRIQASGGSCIECGIDLAREALTSARSALPPGSEVAETMIVVSDGANAAGCDSLVAAAKRAKDAGILVSTVCVTSGCDVPCMRTTATSPRYFFEGRQAGQLGNIFDTIRRTHTAGRLASVSLSFSTTLGLPAVPHSAQPEPSLFGNDNIRWRQDMVPSAEFTVWLQLGPTMAGDLPALDAAGGQLVDNRGRTAPIAFDVPRIVAVGGGALPTVTASAPSPVRTNGLVLSPPQPRAGQRAQLDYHLALDDPVDPQGSHVMIVADTSGSMAGEPNMALKGALRDLVGRLPLGVDPSMKAGIVSFSASATTVVTLTDSLITLDAAIAELGAVGGTCIDCGLRVGLSELLAGRPSPGVEDLVLFSDGENNAGCEPVLAMADRVKAEDITVHTVCLLQTGCDRMCMRNAASPGHYYEAQTVADVRLAFAAVGDALLADRRYDAVAVRLALPPQLRLVPGSFDVAPDAGAGPRDARWTFRPLPLAGLAFHGEVEAVADSAAPAVAVSEAVARDGSIVRWVAEAPLVAPTAVPPPPSPTSTPRPSSEPTASPGATTAVPCAKMYLPVAMRMP